MPALQINNLRHVIILVLQKDFKNIMQSGSYFCIWPSFSYLTVRVLSKTFLTVWYAQLCHRALLLLVPSSAGELKVQVKDGVLLGIAQTCVVCAASRFGSSLCEAQHFTNLHKGLLTCGIWSLIFILTPQHSCSVWACSWDALVPFLSTPLI